MAQAALVLTAAITLVAPLGCAAPFKIPGSSISPYEGDVLWAVVPPTNESGTSAVDAAALGDKIVESVQHVKGMRAVPLNRTLGAMRALGINRVTTPAEARQLAAEMGVDGILTGTITSYDPYNPPSVGLSLALFAREYSHQPDDPGGFDAFLFQLQATDSNNDPGGAGFADRPLAVAGGLYDARGDDILIRVRDYAKGRVSAQDTLGWRAYLASVDLYLEFVAHETVDELLGREWLRLASRAARGG